MKSKKRLDIIGTVKDSIKLLLEKPVIFAPIILIGLVYFLQSFYIYSPGVLSSLWSAAFILPLVVSTLVLYFSQALVIRVVYDCRRRRFSLSSSFGIVGKRFLKILAANILSIIIVGSLVLLFVAPILAVSLGSLLNPGFLLLLVPYLIAVTVLSVYIGIRISFLSYGVIIDNKKVIKSLRSSWKISKGNVVKIFLIKTLASLVFLPVFFLVSILSAVGNMASGASWLTYILTPISIAIDLTAMTLVYEKLRK